MTFVDDYRLEQLNAIIKDDVPQRQLRVLSNLSDKELFQALIVGDEYIAKRLAVRLFHLDETVPVVTVGVVEDDGVAPCKLLELSLPVDFQRRGANDECR